MTSALVLASLVILDLITPRTAAITYLVLVAWSYALLVITAVGERE